MAVLLGTDRGLHRLQGGADAPTVVASEADVRQLQVGGATGRVHVATAEGAYRIDSDGRNWTPIGLDGETVVSIHESESGPVYAGTRPAHVYRAGGPDASFTRLGSFERIPGKEDWTQNYMGPAQVRDIRTHPRAPARLFVAVETDGVWVSHDGGETWSYRGRGLDNDPHGLRLLGQNVAVATCGRGLYRTEDAGRQWWRLDTHQRHFWFQYFREGIVHDGYYYTCAMDRSKHRFEDVDESVMLRSPDRGETLEPVGYPGDDETFVVAWATDGDILYAGTADGRVLRGPGNWTEVAQVEGTVRSLATV